MRCKGFSTEMGVQAGYGDLVRVGGWVSLPHSVFVHDGAFTSTPVIPPTVLEVIRVHGKLADYDLEIPAFASAGVDPAIMGTGPIPSSRAALKKAGWQAGQVDLWEVNEAFAAVTMAAMAEYKLPHEIVNVHGGACAIGHPIGASGARIVVTLLGALKKRGLKKGVAALCIGGGEATAMAVELL
jgi:acetyl-CoA acetyltransferase